MRAAVPQSPKEWWLPRSRGNTWEESQKTPTLARLPRLLGGLLRQTVKKKRLTETEHRKYKNNVSRREGGGEGKLRTAAPSSFHSDSLRF